MENGTSISSCISQAHLLSTSRGLTAGSRTMILIFTGRATRACIQSSAFSDAKRNVNMLYRSHSITENPEQLSLKQSFWFRIAFVAAILF